MSASSPPTADVAHLAWAAITTRVVWTLQHLGIRIRPDVVRDARDHALLQIDPVTPAQTAVDLSERFTRAFVARASGRPFREPWAEDARMPLSPRWRANLFASTRPSPLSGWVLLRHFADGVPLRTLAQQLQEEEFALVAAREGLREVVRRAAAEDGVPLHQWPEDRLDALLHRLACMAADPAPSLLEAIEPTPHPSIRTCPQAMRAHRLAAQGLLTAEMLTCPPRPRPTSRVQIVALQLHPEGRRHRRTLVHEIRTVTQQRTFPLADDILAIEATHPDAVAELLYLASELASPHRDHIRGALVEGPGRWSGRGLLGPLPDTLSERLRPVPWGKIRGLCDLPAPLPPPPKSNAAWAAVAALALITFFVINAAMQPLPDPSRLPLEVSGVPARAGYWLEFDVDEEAFVAIVRHHDGELEAIVDATDQVDKALFATGDGRYRLHTQAEGVLIAAAPEPITSLPEHMGQFQDDPTPLQALRQAITTGHPHATVWTSPPP